MMFAKEAREECLSFLLTQPLKNALDLGCGKGRIAESILKKGIPVVGVDVKNQEFYYPKFQFIKEESRKFKFKEDYDVIVASLLLHFFPIEDSLSLIKKIQAHTTSNGFNFLVCMSKEDDLAKSANQNFYPNKKELLELYKDWKIIKFLRAITKLETHDNLPQHKHNLIFLVVQKSF